MPARSKARKRALDVLFEAEQRRLDPIELLAERQAAADPPVPAYTADLVRGVVANRERLDELISTYTQSWPLERMPSVDRAVLRLGAYELLFVDDVPDAVALSEAVLLARSLSTDESPQFVNGLLARLMSLKPTLSI
ncbi:MAG: transcription antitermination factor NusB [Actinomycetales bacterium]